MNHGINTYMYFLCATGMGKVQGYKESAKCNTTTMLPSNEHTYEEYLCVAVSSYCVFPKNYAWTILYD